MCLQEQCAYLQWNMRRNIEEFRKNRNGKGSWCINMDEEKISIVVAAYNVEKTINQCINSILAQTYTRFELIIVDDGSTDRTSGIVDEWKQRDERIIVIHKANGGLTSARKSGYDISKGMYICFLDSDDYVEKDYLEELHSQMNDITDIVIGSYYVETNGSRTTKSFDAAYIPQCDFTSKLILPSIYYVEAKDEIRYPDFVWLRLYRKSILTEACFVSERECYTEDVFFQFYALLNAQGVSISEKPVYHYVINDKSLTQKYRSNKLHMLENRYRMVREYCINNGINVSEHRYQGLQLMSMFGCIYNARLAGSYSAFRDECKNIHEAFAGCWKIDVKTCYTFANVKQYMIYKFMKKKYYRLLYFMMRI